MGDGEMGNGKGDLGAPCPMVEVGTVSESFGFAARNILKLRGGCNGSSLSQKSSLRL